MVLHCYHHHGRPLPDLHLHFELCSLLQKGIVYHFLLEDWEYVSEFHHHCSVKRVFPNHLGTLLVFVDEKAEVYVLNVVGTSVGNVCFMDFNEIN